MTDATEYPACPLRPPDWDYTCRSCGKSFTLPPAKGPTEEKQRACPACGDKNIERVNIAEAETCPPGG